MNKLRIKNFSNGIFTIFNYDIFISYQHMCCTII